MLIAKMLWNIFVSSLRLLKSSNGWVDKISSRRGLLDVMRSLGRSVLLYKYLVSEQAGLSLVAISLIRWFENNVKWDILQPCWRQMNGNLSWATVGGMLMGHVGVEVETSSTMLTVGTCANVSLRLINLPLFYFYCFWTIRNVCEI